MITRHLRKNGVAESDNFVIDQPPLLIMLMLLSFFSDRVSDLVRFVFVHGWIRSGSVNNVRQTTTTTVLSFRAVSRRHTTGGAIVGKA